MTRSAWDAGEPVSPATRSAWDAAAYDQLHGYVVRGGEGVVELLAPRPGERILDLGCGTGQLTKRIADLGAHVVGIDSSPTMVERAHAQYPELDFRVADATSLPIDPRFDAVFSNAVLHWIPQPAHPTVAAAIARALPPGGRFVAEFGGRGNVQQIVAALEDALAALGYDAAAANPWYFPGVGAHATVLEAAGLRVVYAELFDRPTRLEDGAAGLRHWLEMFGRDFLSIVPIERRPEVIHAVEQRLRPGLYRDGVWYADYRRLRVAAIKEA